MPYGRSPMPEEGADEMENEREDFIMGELPGPSTKEQADIKWAREETERLKNRLNEPALSYGEILDIEKENEEKKRRKAIEKLEEESLVEHPDHYGGGTWCEVDKVIVGWDMLRYHWLAEAIQYIVRHDKKGTPMRDLEKAKYRIQCHIDLLKGDR